MTSPESEARKAIARLRRYLEKTSRELGSLAGALRRAEGSDFPADDYAGVERRIADLVDFLDAEAQRLEDKILTSGGLEPGRVRRSSSR
jgi:hypothetical protein